jgi:hypothetical protein
MRQLSFLLVLFVLAVALPPLVKALIRCGEDEFPVPVLREEDCPMFVEFEKLGLSWVRARFLMAQTYLLEDIALSLRALLAHGNQTMR